MRIATAAALLGLLGAIGAASVAQSESLNACIETAARCRERCQGKAPCEAICERAWRQCKLRDSDTRPDYPRDSVMPR